MRITKIIVLMNLLFVLVACSTNAPPTGNSPTAKRMVRHLPHYVDLARRSWPPIRTARLIKPGMRAALVPKVRKRLILLGDLPQAVESPSPLYDKQLAQGVRLFQWRHGLKADGVIGAGTLSALNVTPEQRLRQLRNSMRKWAEFPDNVGNEYIRINIASFELDLIKDGDKLMNMRVIVGKPTRQTPTLYSKIRTIVLNPKWNVPKGIVRADVIPGMIKDKNYLTEHNIRIYSSWRKDAYEIHPDEIDWEAARKKGFRYKLSQPPGDDNPLGRVKFIFLNEHDVYLHDTPQKGLFDKIRRAYSSGCLRVEKPFQLVEYFLRDNDRWDNTRVVEHLDTYETKYIRLKNPMPIYVAYITAWVDEKGYVHFREDIYQRDK